DFAHTAGADGLDNLIRAEPCACRQTRHFSPLARAAAQCCITVSPVVMVPPPAPLLRLPVALARFPILAKGWASGTLEAAPGPPAVVMVPALPKRSRNR